MPGSAATFKEFGQGKLHSGSPRGPLVTKPKQAIAIALHQQDKANYANRIASMAKKQP
jgi:hypothetical protein